MMRPGDVSLSELLVLVAQGDKTVFRTVYDRAGSRIFAVCLRLMRSRAEAEDVYQEAFVKIWEKSWRFDPAKGEALAWMVTIARHCALDRLRSAPARTVEFDDAVVSEIDRTTAGTAAWEGSDLGRCLGKLREDFRRSILLAYMNGYTHEEIAAALGRPLGTVKSWVTRGLSQLKECLEA